MTGAGVYVCGWKACMACGARMTVETPPECCADPLVVSVAVGPTGRAAAAELMHIRSAYPKRRTDVRCNA